MFILIGMQTECECSGAKQQKKGCKMASAADIYNSKVAEIIVHNFLQFLMMVSSETETVTKP